MQQSKIIIKASESRARHGEYAVHFIYLMAQISSNLHLLYRSLACERKKDPKGRRRISSKHILKRRVQRKVFLWLFEDSPSLAKSGSEKSLISFAFYSRKRLVKRANKNILETRTKWEFSLAGKPEPSGKLFNKLSPLQRPWVNFHNLKW